MLPTHLRLGKKTVPLSLNWYRNAHRQVLNNAKKKFEQEVSDQIKDLDYRGRKIYLTYITDSCGSKRIYDCMNFVAVIDKFFCDSLVNKNVIDDDNYRIVKKVEAYPDEICNNKDKVLRCFVKIHKI